MALRITAAAAVVAVLAVGGIQIAKHSGTSSPSASSGSARSGAAPFAGGRNFAAGPALYYTRNGQEYRVSAVNSGTDYTPGQLSHQVSQLTSSRASGAAGPAVAPTVPGTLPQSGSAANGASGTFGNFSVANLNGCLNRIAGGNLLIVVVDVARYQGSPATVIVAELSSAGPLQVWVVGTGCSASHSDTLAHTQLGSGS